MKAPPLKKVTIPRAQKSDVFVLQTETCTYRAWPPVLVTANDRMVWFRNLTAKSVVVKLPWGFTPQALTLRPGKKDKAKLSPTASGTFTYEIEIMTGQVASGLKSARRPAVAFRAEGFSSPRIIVDP